MHSSKKKCKTYNIENDTLEKETTCICAGQISNFILLIQNGKNNIKFLI